MRDIKFRAWHKLNKELVYFDNDKLVNDQYQMQHLACLMRGDYGDVLMQYTGLKDKNGTEVYEGDLITVRHKNGEYLIKEKPTELYFSEGAFQFELLSESREMFLFEVCSSDNSTAISHTCEVVGNIYETPELLP